MPDNTKLEGYFQSEKIILHRKKEVREWLKIKPAFDCKDFCGDNICVMNVRGGEYKWNPDLLLRKKYWTVAVKNMLRINPGLGFVVITDDVKYAAKILPEYPVFHFNVGKDYAVIKNAKYLILSNSSFSFFPTWTSETVKYVIAPKYWARHNVSDGFWACAFNLYRDWMWQDRNGDLFTFGQCEAEYADYAARVGVDKFQGRPPVKPLSVFERGVRKALWLASEARNRLTGY